MSKLTKKQMIEELVGASRIVNKPKVVGYCMEKTNEYVEMAYRYWKEGMDVDYCVACLSGGVVNLSRK